MIVITARTLMLAVALAVFASCSSRQPSPQPNPPAHNDAARRNPDQPQSDPDNPVSAMFNWPVQALQNIVP